MTITRVYHQVEDLLQNLKEQLTSLMAGAYLVYLVVYTLIIQPEFPVGFHDGRYWGGLLAIIILVASRLDLLRNKKYTTTILIALIPIIVAQTYRLLHLNDSPGDLFLWMSITIMGLYVVLGSKIANILAFAIMTCMTSVFLGNLPEEKTLKALWWAGISVLSLVAFVSTRITVFIERNLLMHEQSTYQLEAARLDALTKAYGRAAIEEEIQNAIEYADIYNIPLSIIVTDIDHFKKVNDKHGHNMGDAILRTFVRRLKKHVGNNGGLIGRWGGEEFVILLPGMSRPDAKAVAESLRKTIAANPMRGLPITASFGVSSFRKEHDDLEQMFARADEKLYDAKMAGRNLVR